ncbi:glutamate receptor ionotropic, kainate 2-like [Lineus longissimus]|uniref:glutamate receptor ionotropic, kainate 2-like n=1 Tax=Lineus longissimus TaxID=88925 RepID=UPI00315D12B2
MFILTLLIVASLLFEGRFDAVEDVGNESNVSTYIIGAVIDTTDSVRNILFKAMQLAAERINNDPNRLQGSRIELLFPPNTPPPNTTQSYDSTTTFGSIKMVSSAIRQNALAIIGPVSSTRIRATYPISSGLHVPQIAPWATDPRLSDNHHPYLLKMTSPDNLMNRAMYDLVSSFMWTRVSILTDDTDFGLNGVNEFIKLASSGDVRISGVLSFQPVDPEVLDVTEQLEEIKGKGTTVVILHCFAKHAKAILQQAYTMGILKSKWVWIVTEFSSEPHLNIPSNLTGLLGIRPSSGHGSLYKEFEVAMMADNPTGSDQQHVMAFTHGHNAWRCYDAVLTIGYALDAYLKENEPINHHHNSCICETGTPFQWGEKLVRYMKKVKGPGATSDIEFNEFGYPKTANFEIVNLKTGEGWVKVGDWSESRPNHTRLVWEKALVTFPGKPKRVPNGYRDNIRGTHLRVVTVLDPPFVRRRRDPATLLEEEELEGYCIDLIKKLQQLLQFDYDIYLEENNVYGAPTNGSLLEWSGMVKDLLLDKKADLAVAAAFISTERAKVIDFSTAYYEAGLTILMKKEQVKSEGFWPFIAPFDMNLWILILVGTFFTTGALYVIEFLSPYGQYGVYIQRHDRDDQHFRDTRFFMNLRNSFQFCYAAFVGINIDGVPRSFSGRLVGNYWYLLVFFITAGYTANFAAFLTISQINKQSISSLTELTLQNKVKYGTLDESNLAHFVNQGTTETYARMAQHNENFETNVRSVDRGIWQVKNGFNGNDYAFIYDEPILKYRASIDPDCELETIGKSFRKASYGIMARKNSPFLDTLDSAILELKEDGFMEDLEKLWFQRGDCYEMEKTTTFSNLRRSDLVMTATQMSGIFMIGGGVIGIALILVICEFIFASVQDIKKYKNDEGAPNTILEALKIRLDHVIKEMKILLRKSLLCQHATHDKMEDEILRESDAMRKTVKYPEMFTKF